MRSRRTTPGSGGACSLAILVATLLLCGCAAKKPWGDRRLPPSAMLPLGAPRPIDVSAAFADLFCSTLALHVEEGAAWEDCGRYLEPAGRVRPLPPLNVSHEVLIVPGVLGRCVADKVPTFGRAVELLEDKGVEAGHIDVSGLGSSTFNAGQIAEHLRAELHERPEATFILVGYSKGAPDAMEALALHPEIANHVAALVTVAGAVGGSRVPDTVGKRVRRLVRDLAPDRCGQGDGGAFESLERKHRLEFLRDHAEPAVPTYSLVAVSSRENTSRIHLESWKQLDAFDADQDSQMLAYDAIAPGARYLGAALGDHWAVAMPFEHAGPLWKIPVDKNHFPRAALLEAIVRFVVADLEARATR